MTMMMSSSSLCAVASSTPPIAPISIPPTRITSVPAAAALRNSRGLRCHNNNHVGKLCMARRSMARTVMGIRAVESYDASFQLQAESDQLLRSLLASETFCKQVAKESGLDTIAGVTTEFSGLLFQPVPWSPTTKHGMPQEFEVYLHDKDRFAIVNVPPNFMFQAKIFKPSRLCAIFKKSSGS